jgi:HlyD family secretion protein
MDRVIENKAKKRRKYYWIGGSTIVVALLVWQIFFADHSSKLNVDAERVTIVEVVEQEFLDYMNANGAVEPISTIYLDAVEGGRIEEILIEEGNMVEEGDVILVLSNPDLNLRILTNQANLAEQENRLRDTKIMMEQQRIELRRQIIQLEYDLIRLDRDYKNNSGLFKKGLIAEQEYLLSKENFELSNKTITLFKERSSQDSVFRATQVVNLENALDRMRENLELVKEKLESLKLRAPVNGQLGALNADIGQNVAMGFRLGQINVLDDYKVAAQVDQHWIDRIKKNLAATIDRNNKQFNLKITKVYPEVRNGQFQVDLVFTSEKPENIRAGQTYRISIELGQPQIKIQIPQGGFFSTTGGQWIYVVDPSGQFAEKRSIRTGKENPRYYEILEGLEAGEKVINSSYSTFGNNDKLILK